LTATLSITTSAKQYAIDLPTADKGHAVAVVQEDPDPDAARETGVEAAELVYQTALADASLGWTTTVAGAEKTFAIMAKTGHEESESQETKCPVRIFRKS
jgi:hypothetical protein